MIRFNDMSTEQQARCEQVMALFSKWLNQWHREYHETWVNDEGEEVAVEVIRDNYFEYDDPPGLLLDSGPTVETYYRIIVFSLNPYHDEGGPNELTCYFDDDYTLRHVDQLFDTMIQPIFNEGKFLSSPSGQEVEVE